MLCRSTAWMLTVRMQCTPNTEGLLRSYAAGIQSLMSNSTFSMSFMACPGSVQLCRPGKCSEVCIPWHSSFCRRATGVSFMAQKHAFASWALPCWPCPDGLHCSSTNQPCGFTPSIAHSRSMDSKAKAAKPYERLIKCHQTMHMANQASKLALAVSFNRDTRPACG